MKSFCLHTSDQNENNQEKNPKLFSCQQFPGTFFSLCTHVCEYMCVAVCECVCVCERCGKLKCLANICFAKNCAFYHWRTRCRCLRRRRRQLRQLSELSQLWQPINTYLNRSLWHSVICEPPSPLSSTLLTSYLVSQAPSVAFSHSMAKLTCPKLSTTKMPRTLLIFIGLKINWTESYKFFLLLLRLHLIFGKNKMLFPCQREG